MLIFVKLSMKKRKSENMDNKINDTLKKVAEYATEEINERKERLRTFVGRIHLSYVN